MVQPVLGPVVGQEHRKRRISARSSLMRSSSLPFMIIFPLCQSRKRRAGVDCDSLMFTLVVGLECGLSELRGARIQLVGGGCSDHHPGRLPTNTDGGGLCLGRSCAQTHSPKAMHWLTSRRQRRHRHPHRLVHGAAVGDLYRCAYTAHPTESGLERDNTPADCKSRKTAPLSCLACQSWRPITQRRFLMDRSLSRAAWQYCRYLSRSVSTGGFRHRQRRTDYAQEVGAAGDSS
jgi:hypothetical protein